MLIPLILGSHKDLPFSRRITDELKKYDLEVIVRICSAHKFPTRLLPIIDGYNNNKNVPLLVTIAGKSNALSALICGSCSKPVIACPPLKHESMYDLSKMTYRIQIHR